MGDSSAHVREDCVNLRVHEAFIGFSTGPAGTESHPAYGCALYRVGIGGCPDECPHYEPLEK